MSEATPTRRPFTGGCHCGFTKFIVWLTLPHKPIPAGSPPGSGLRMYKCSCTVCHKAGLLHVRPTAPADDFLLLSPLDPENELGVYRCNDRFLRFTFCKTCGDRCIVYWMKEAKGEAADMNLKALGVSDDQLKKLGVEEAEAEKVKVWKLDAASFNPAALEGYLSVNGYAIDAGQEGINLPEWTDKGWVIYNDGFHWVQPPRATPYPEGAY